MSTEKKPLVELWPIGNIIPYELNVKKHDRNQVSRIVQSIQRFGWSDGQAMMNSSTLAEVSARESETRRLGADATHCGRTHWPKRSVGRPALA